MHRCMARCRLWRLPSNTSSWRGAAWSSTLRQSQLHYAAMDAMLVQTRAHASLLASWGHTAVVLPHSHGEPPVLTRTPWCLRTGLLRAVRTWGTWQLVCHGTYVVRCVPASGVPYVPRAVWCTTGNLQHWSVAGDVRPSVRGVGFVVSVRPAHSNRC